MHGFTDSTCKTKDYISADIDGHVKKDYSLNLMLNNLRLVMTAM